MGLFDSVKKTAQNAVNSVKETQPTAESQPEQPVQVQASTQPETVTQEQQQTNTSAQESQVVPQSNASPELSFIGKEYRGTGLGAGAILKSTRFFEDHIQYGNVTIPYSDLLEITIQHLASRMTNGEASVIRKSTNEVLYLTFNTFVPGFEQAVDYANMKIAEANGTVSSRKFMLRSADSSKLDVYEDYLSINRQGGKLGSMIGNNDSTEIILFQQISNISSTGTQLVIDYTNEDGVAVKSNFAFNPSDANTINEIISYVQSYTPETSDESGEETWTFVTGVERQFPLLGRTLTVNENWDVYNSYRTMYKNCASAYAQQLKAKYLKKINNFDTFMRFYLPLYKEYLEKLVNKTTDILVSAGVWTETSESIMQRHIEKYQLALEDYATMYQSLEATVQNNKARVAAITSFVPNLVGGGFGLKGAAMGIAQATAFNLIRDGAESALIDRMNISATQKTELYGRIRQDVLFDRAFQDYWNVYRTLIDILNENGKNVWVPSEADSAKADNVMKNVSNPNFPQAQFPDVIISVISMDPYKESIYDLLRKRGADETEVSAISGYFGYSDGASVVAAAPKQIEATSQPVVSNTTTEVTEKPAQPVNEEPIEEPTPVISQPVVAEAVPVAAVVVASEPEVLNTVEDVTETQPTAESQPEQPVQVQASTQPETVTQEQQIEQLPLAAQDEVELVILEQSQIEKTEQPDEASEDFIQESVENEATDTDSGSYESLTDDVVFEEKEKEETHQVNEIDEETPVIETIIVPENTISYDSEPQITIEEQLNIDELSSDQTETPIYDDYTENMGSINEQDKTGGSFESFVPTDEKIKQDTEFESAELLPVSDTVGESADEEPPLESESIKETNTRFDDKEMKDKPLKASNSDTDSLEREFFVDDYINEKTKIIEASITNNSFASKKSVFIIGAVLLVAVAIVCGLIKQWIIFGIALLASAYCVARFVMMQMEFNKAKAIKSELDGDYKWLKDRVLSLSANEKISGEEKDNVIKKWTDKFTVKLEENQKTSKDISFKAGIIAGIVTLLVVGIVAVSPLIIRVISNSMSGTTGESTTVSTSSENNVVVTETTVTTSELAMTESSDLTEITTNGTELTAESDVVSETTTEITETPTPTPTPTSTPTPTPTVTPTPEPTEPSETTSQAAAAWYHDFARVGRVVSFAIRGEHGILTLDLEYDKEYSGTASMSYFDDDDESLNFDLDGTFEESNMQGTFYFKGNAPYKYYVTFVKDHFELTLDMGDRILTLVESDYYYTYLI